MILRKNILPRSFLDAACFGFVLLFIPCVYWFELFVVLPSYYSMWSFWYSLHFICGNFVAMNLITNLLAMVVVDTSVKGHVMPTEMLPGWRFCPICECIVPPRSWHCDTCQTCILKRDHHCVFSGCCIGHKNSRYFILFLIYVTIATAYSTYFNCFFIWNLVDFQRKITWLKIVFPLAMLMYENTTTQLYLLLFLLIIIAMVFAGVLTWFHVSLMLSGQVTHEKNLNIEGYDYGLVRNIEMVFGKRWYLSWLTASVVSELPHDGINWEPKETLKNK